jgi:predicted ATPase/DNA-binding CsgD family transcriptional regulator
MIERRSPSFSERRRHHYPLTSFVGRTADIDAVTSLLAEPGTRLVTLTGPGGIGKTRLAIEVASIMESAFPDGIYFVDLASVHDPVLVIQEVASVLEIREAGERQLLQRLGLELEDREVLLILDNFEQVIDAAVTVNELLDRTDRPKMIATSREALRLSQEREFPVRPLSSEVSGETTASLGPAVELFFERAGSIHGQVSKSESDIAEAAEICDLLDGMPLAIELAAARLRHLSMRDLRIRLENRLPILTGGARDQPKRLQTMRNAIGWSYDLLTEGEQTLFRSLAVFRGGWTLEAALAIDDHSSDADVVDALSGLVEKNLMLIHETGDRYRMLATIREFGLEQQALNGETEDLRERHASWFLDFVERAHPSFAGRVGQEAWLARFEAEHENLRQALGWLLESGQVDAAHRFCSGTFWYWYVQGKLTEGRRWLDRTLELAWPLDRSTEHRAWVLIGAGLISHFQGDEPVARDLILEGLSHSTGAGFVTGEAIAQLILGIMDEDRGRYVEATAWLEKALQLFRSTGDRANEALTLYHLGIVTWSHHRQAAIDLCRTALSIQSEIGDLWGRANTLGMLGLFLIQDGPLDQGLPLVQQSLRDRRRHGAPVDIADNLASIAAIGAKLGQFERSATLFGTETRIRHEIGSWRRLPEREIFDQASTTARAGLGDFAFEAAFRAGEALSTDAAIELALSTTVLTEPASELDRVLLSKRELEVLKQLAAGRSNADIAERLFLSPGTVRNHVSNILTKLAVRSRTEAVTVAHQRRLLDD